MTKEKEKSELKLRELRKWTKVKLKDGRIAEFRLVDGMYCNWLIDDEIIIMWCANQKVSEYGEIID